MVPVAAMCSFVRRLWLFRLSPACLNFLGWFPGLGRPKTVLWLISGISLIKSSGLNSPAKILLGGVCMSTILGWLADVAGATIGTIGGVDVTAGMIIAGMAVANLVFAFLRRLRRL
jgi:hypothetical protein